MLNVLFLCTRNAVRSILAESILRSTDRGRFAAFSAGCKPAGAISGEVLDYLRDRHMPLEGLRPKSWVELAPGPQFDFVIALSTKAAALLEAHAWPGEPVTAHWTIDEDDEAEQERSSWAIRDSFWVLTRRIKIFTSLPHGKASRVSLQRRLHAMEAWQ